MSCSDKAGNKISQYTGIESKLIQWASNNCQTSTECKAIDKIQSKNKDVKVICIKNFRNIQVMSCLDKNGTILSTKTGKVKDLVKWVQSKECKTGDDHARKVI